MLRASQLVQVTDARSAEDSALYEQENVHRCVAMSAHWQRL